MKSTSSINIFKALRVVDIEHKRLRLLLLELKNLT